MSLILKERWQSEIKRSSLSIQPKDGEKQIITLSIFLDKLFSFVKWKFLNVWLYIINWNLKISTILSVNIFSFYFNKKYFCSTSKYTLICKPRQISLYKYFLLFITISLIKANMDSISKQQKKKNLYTKHFRRLSAVKKGQLLQIVKKKISMHFLVPFSFKTMTPFHNAKKPCSVLCWRTWYNFKNNVWNKF